MKIPRSLRNFSGWCTSITTNSPESHWSALLVGINPYLLLQQPSGSDKLSRGDWEAGPGRGAAVGNDGW